MSSFEAPGAVNAHTHLYSGLVPLGMPAPEVPPTNFVEILERVWWRLDRALDAQILRAAARYHVAHALLAGTTTLVDHHESPAFIDGSLDILADAAQDLGCRTVVCYGATDRNRGEAEGHEGLLECARFLSQNQRSLVRGAVGLHASFTVSDATVILAGEVARRMGAVVHVHVAEDGADVADAKARGYDGPLSRLAGLRALPVGSIVAHGVHLGPEAIALANETGCWLVQNPRSNANNKVGYPEHVRAADRVALGTDGFASDMEAEAGFLRETGHLHGESIGAAKGRLGAGRALAAQFFGTEALQGDRVRGVETSRRRVDEVDVDGRAVVRGGRLVAADLAEIEREASIEAERLWKRMRDVRP